MDYTQDMRNVEVGDRQAEASRPAKRGAALGAIHWVTICATAVLVLLGASLWRYGSARGALAALRGQTIMVDAEAKSFGTVIAGQPVTVQFLLTNLSAKSVRVVGSQTSCTCTVPEPLPIIIGPHEGRVFKVDIDATGNQPDFDQQVTFFTNVPNQSRFVVQIHGAVSKR